MENEPSVIKEAACPSFRHLRHTYRSAKKTAPSISASSVTAVTATTAVSGFRYTSSGRP